MNMAQRRELLESAIGFAKSVREIAERLGSYSFESSRHVVGEPLEASILSHWRAGRQAIPAWVEPALVAIIDDISNEIVTAHEEFMLNQAEITLTRARQLQALRAKASGATK